MTCTLLRAQPRSPQPPRHDKLHIVLIAFSQKHLLCLINCQLSSHSTECRPSFYFRMIAFPLNSVSICFQLLHFPHLIVSSNMSDDLKSIIPDFLGPDQIRVARSYCLQLMAMIRFSKLCPPCTGKNKPCTCSRPSKGFVPMRSSHTCVVNALTLSSFQRDCLHFPIVHQPNSLNLKQSYNTCCKRAGEGAPSRWEPEMFSLKAELHGT